MGKNIFVLLTLIFFIGCKQSIKIPNDSKPNIIIILADDQGFGDVSFNQHSSPAFTPSIDRIAKTGIVFTQGYAACPMCAPSRAALLSGRYPQRMGIFSNNLFTKLPPEIKIAPQFFNELGYATALIGKWHLGGEIFKDKFLTNRGFDRFYGVLSNHDYWKATTGGSVLFGSNGYQPLYDQEKAIHEKEYATREFTREALQFIEGNKDRPFFLYLAYTCSHVPTAISWPAVLPQNKIYGYPVMSIDFLPTLLSATGIKAETEFDGVDLIPYLLGEKTELPHPDLYWSTGGQWAVREGDWKLLISNNGHGLFNLNNDPGERIDLREIYPDKVLSLTEKFDNWNSKNIIIEPGDKEREYVEQRKAEADILLKDLGYASKFGQN